MQVLLVSLAALISSSRLFVVILSIRWWSASTAALCSIPMAALASPCAVVAIRFSAGRVQLSGASQADGSLTMTNGDFELSGASTLSIEGSARDVSVDASGASRADLSDFPVTNARIDLSGASNSTVNASGELNADLSGASTLHYIGNPTLGDISTSGASTISRK